jgi:hypothetical protein
MDIFDFIAEQRMAKAVARGEFDNLPGAGRPLLLDDDALVPPELRVAYRMLRNAGWKSDCSPSSVPPSSCLPEQSGMRSAPQLRRACTTCSDDSAPAAY